MGGLVGALYGSTPAQTVLFEEDFENGWNSWYADNGVWEVGEATVGPVGSGNVAGTILNGNYPYQANSRLVSPQIILPAVPEDGALWLRFAYWFNLHTSDGTDYGRVQIRSRLNGSWQTYIDLSGQLWGWSPYWSEYMADLSSFAGDSVQVAFLIDDEDGGNVGHNESNGLYLDHVVILEGDFPSRRLQTFDLSLMHPWDGWYASRTDWQGWYAENGCWQVGESGNPHSGLHCAGTNLNGNYSYAANSRLISPPYDLPADPAGGQIWLSFWSYHGLATSDGWDNGQVQIQVAGGTWESLLGDYTAWAGCWAPCVADLSAYAGETVRLAFRMVDVDGGNVGSNQASGWYVDDISVSEGQQWFNNPEDCEGTITGWAAWQGLWQLGQPSSGPGAAHSGDHCWGTNLSGSYGYASNSTLESTWIPVSADSPGQFCFWHWFSFATADGTDYGQLRIVHEGGTTLIEDFTGSSGGWSVYCVDLSPYAGQSVRIRFSITDVDGGNVGSNQSSGWYLDDFEFTGLPASTPAAPGYFDVIQAADPPELQYYANPNELAQVCLYYMHDAYLDDPDDIPALGNRLAVLPAGFGQFFDEEHPGGNRRYYCITGIDLFGHEGRIVGPAETGIEEPGELPSPPQVVLHGVQPNPFNPKAELRFTLSRPEHVTLEIFDLSGRLVNRLRDEAMPAGTHAVTIEGDGLASGLYLGRLEAGGQIRSCKMILLK